MSTAEMEEKKRLIIQEIQLVEEEWILKAIEKLLDLENLSDFDTQFEMEKNPRRKSVPIDYATQNFALTDEEWKKIEMDEENFKKGKGANYTWEEVKNLTLNDGK